MASYSTNDFKAGLKVMIDNSPGAVVENEFVKPGKGQAFNRVRLRNLLNGRVWERTFKSGETLDGADVSESSMEYLYSDGEFYHFMKTDGSFEQIAADKNTHAKMLLELRWADETAAKTSVQPMPAVEFGCTLVFAAVSSAQRRPACSRCRPWNSEQAGAISRTA